MSYCYIVTEGHASSTSSLTTSGRTIAARRRLLQLRNARRILSAQGPARRLDRIRFATIDVPKRGVDCIHGKATRSCPARHRDRDCLLIFFVGCRSVRVAAAVVFLTDLLVRATPVVLPMSLGPIPCDLMMAQSSFRAGLDARVALGIVRRPTIGVSGAFPRPCHVVDAVRPPRP